jgi:hypothetical protein
MSATISRLLRGCSQVGPQEKGANASGTFVEAPTLIFQKLDFLIEAVFSFILLLLGIGTSFFKATVPVQK